jgi:2-(1,2-epoxy-1,2-dihydrophenyl)acetyl-CoA isomerase
VLRGLDLSLADAIRFEAGFRAVVGHTEDAGEGPRAFSEKRKPRFKGR